MYRLKTIILTAILTAILSLTAATAVHASEADLAIPDLHKGRFDSLGGISAWNLLFYGSFVILGTLGISLTLRAQIYKLPAHKSMLDIAEIIFQTCKTYLIQQGKFLLMLFVLIYVVERRSLVSALAVSIGVTVASYFLFGTLLKSPLPPMPFWS